MKALTTLAILLLATSCNDGTGNDTPADVAADGGLVDGGIFESDATPGPDATIIGDVFVTVVRDGVPILGQPVVFHNEGGQPLETQLTDADGRVHSQANASIVTVVGFDMFSVFDVQADDHLHIETGYGPSAGTTTAPKIGVPDPPDGTLSVVVQSGCDSDGGPDWAEDFALNVDERCRNASGEFHLLAYARAALSTITHFSSATDLASDTEALLMPGWHTDFVDFTWTIANGPFHRTAFFEASQVVDDIAFRAPTKSGNTQSNIFQVVPSFAEYIQYEGSYRLGTALPNGSHPSKAFFGKRIPNTETSDSIDVSIELLPQVTGATVINSGPGVANISWTTIGDTSETDGILVRSRWFATGGMYTWAFSVPPDVDTFDVPTLPPELSEFSPTASLDTPYVVVVESTDFEDRRAFREQGMALINGLRFLKSGLAYVRGSSYFPAPF